MPKVDKEELFRYLEVVWLLNNKKIKKLEQ